MNNSFEYDIERYLENRMNDEEVKNFENRLASDKDFAKEFESTRAAYQLVQIAGRKELTEILDSFEEESEKETLQTKKRTWLKPMVSVAAAMVVFLTIYEFAFNKAEVNTGVLYEEYFTKYSDPSVMRNSQDTILINWKTAVTLYRNQKYSEAIPYFEKAEVPAYLSSFYAGLSLLQLEAPNQASTEKFDLVLQGDNDYQQQALWYKGLALLKLEKRKEALVIFKTIVAEESYQSDKAQEIITQLSKN